MTTTKSTSWADQGDGTAWLYVAADPDQYGWAVALDRPCDTCKGKRDLPHGFVHPRLWGGKPAPCVTPCPDCINGRHTFTIDVACPCTLGRSGSMPDCKGTGVISLRVSIVPGMVLPIITNSNDWEHGYTNHIDLMGTTAILRTNTEGFSQDAEIINPFPPDAKPGGWAVHLNWRPA